MTLQNNTILITGGSSGIGLELTKRLLEKNNKLLICGRSKENLEKAQKLYPQIDIFQCDLSRQEECEQLAHWVQEKHNKCNILINNAAIVHTANFYDDDKILESAYLEIQTNLLAPITLSKLFIPILENNPNPKFINITSGLVYTPKGAYPFYNCTKAALHSFTQVLRMQMKESKIDILEIFPPAVDTPWHKGNPPKTAISVEKAVDDMIKGIEKGKIEIRVGVVKLLYFISRITPKFALKKVNSIK